ncbi:MAG TPA: porin [Phenylobacterium sp.]|uniref:porin n=1 Tax=Phenylobacterium sp. TaxID=1871053 RepID=UPI002B46273B|nr:porin [Phenylobacterium sp.]HKR90344.1 porin [Phenylobacterium sp.]
MTALAHTTFRAVALAGLLCSVAPAALAQTLSTQPAQAASGISQEQALALTARLDALEQQNEALQAQVSDLKAQVGAGEAAIRQDIAAQPKVSLAGARPTISTPDGNFKFALRSIIQFDAADYSIAPLRTDNDLGSGTNFRRVRFGFDGTAFKDWNYALWAEFGGSGGEAAGLNQAYLEYTGFKPFGSDVDFRIRGGAWATPAGLEDATSNTEELFLERAAVAELVRGLAAGDGRAGAGVFANGQHWYGSAVYTGKVVGVPSTPEFDQQSGYVFRVAFNPLHGQDYDVHIGGSIQGVLTAADITQGPGKLQQIRLRERPELRVDGNRLVDTGAINAAGETSYGVEVGASFKNFYAAGEWYKIDVNRSNVSTTVRSPFDPEFSGWYAQGAYTLTGERHVWSSANGGFRGIRPDRPFSRGPNGGWGAWELAGRYSVLDLNDHAGAAGRAAPVGGVRGGEQKIATVGINWYPNSVLRFLLDYQWGTVDRLSATGGALNTDLNMVSFRTQVAF